MSPTQRHALPNLSVKKNIFTPFQKTNFQVFSAMFLCIYTDDEKAQFQLTKSFMIGLEEQVSGDVSS